MARIAATTSTEGGTRINEGYTGTTKGAGIRLFEYASKEVIALCRIQLETLYWLCSDSLVAVTQFGMNKEEAIERRESCLKKAAKLNLLDYPTLQDARLVDASNVTVCPLCLERLSALGFFNRMAQAPGREVHDLTVTQINLFHIEELRYGTYNHRQYNLGWGHHHCNVVAKDDGIAATLEWMQEVLDRNKEAGYSTTEVSEIN